ncbi:NUDIX hydrolase [Schaalia sp. 19OD2882]|uniref:NUDIX hydrolase n=1 Tax=Schaalia sp. 19OD2882 TaxID=2794089 RepID=UPI001C1EFB40|nr:NUDIX hydrolase [Schaalia sp. 19OD2882]QWW19621.1 NUDIX hydrolase [Schaalia sp. 19OD2882]
MSARPLDRHAGVPRPPRRRTSSRAPHAAHPKLPVSAETSAGGVVIDVRAGIPYVALIARRNRTGRIEWCLPKGHLEAGESAERAALREVAEETGIRGRIIRHLASIDYWFSNPDRRVHKVVHHYLMGYVGGRITVEGDPDHEAEDAAWVPLKESLRLLAYPNERRIVGIALDLLYQD